ncbi:slipin family protein [Breznakiella homolactica]|uniref:Slipin family protein n=1 Tax=Breznakiella homolactica TaxID=2798577 RepID=A0A7T7XPS9_9SPIR|nr:slipin family protein [Breznakiella homolactica]QQO10260.1 slipin family protein [Breznakiella homolactica]
MRILSHERGLLYRGDLYKSLLMPGTHWVPPFCRVETYRVDKAFSPQSTPLEILLEDAALAGQAEVINVPDNHIAIHREDGNVKDVLLPGKHCFWKGYTRREFIQADLSEPEGTAALDRSILAHSALAGYIAAAAVEPHQKGLLVIDRAFVRILEPGTYYFWKGPRRAEILAMDMRQQQFEITGQEIMSRDKVPLRLNFFCQYRITDVMKAGFKIQDYDRQFHVILQLALREYIGSLLFDDIMDKKESIGPFVAQSLKPQADAFGIELGHSGIKDIILPGEIREIMNQVLVAEKKAQANVIMRREETASTRSLLNTAKLMEENKVLMRLKEFEYIERISEKINQITLSGGNQIIDQLGQLFIPGSGEK